jgi:hypothetical protein
MSPSPSQRERAGSGALLLPLCLSISCVGDPYMGLKAENIDLGPVDPVTFPAENLGTDGNRMQQGAGTFVEIPAFVAGEAVGYFAYPVKTPATRDALRVLDEGKPYAGVTTPTAYAFDATDELPVPAKNKCAPPAGYHASKRLDPMAGWFSRQGNIFTDIPRATYNPGVAAASTYIPVVAEARASSSGRICQDLKSEKALQTALAGKLPKTTGRYLAWLMIDPGASVFTFDDEVQDPKTSILLQKWGWYSRYLVAYLDGGYIPTADVQVPVAMDPMVTKTVTRMVTQKLYFPRGQIQVAPMMMVPGRIGQGFDVLTAKRGTEGYSPVCEVFSYDPAPPPAMPTTPPTPAMPVPVEMLPDNAMTIETMYGMTLMPATPRYVYCLQVR